MLADITRLKLLKLFYRQCRPDALCVEMLVRLLDVSQLAVSQHVRVLRSTGLVKGERRGCRMRYFANRGVLEKCCQLVLSALTAELPESSPECSQECPLAKDN